MPFLSNQDLIFLSTSLLEKSKEFKELVHNRLYMKQGLLNILSELMERKLFSYIPIFEAELESMLRPYDVFEKLLWQFLKKMSVFSSNQRKQSKKRLKNFYPISASIRKSTIDNPLRIAFATIQRTYRLVRNGKMIIISAMIANNLKTCFFI